MALASKFSVVRMHLDRKVLIIHAWLLPMAGLYIRSSAILCQMLAQDVHADKLGLFFHTFLVAFSFFRIRTLPRISFAFVFSFVDFVDALEGVCLCGVP